MVDEKNMTQEQTVAYEKGYLDAKNEVLFGYMPIEPKEYYNAGYRSFSTVKVSTPTRHPSHEGTQHYNPRYTLYAKAHGKNEKEMLDFDKERAKGGCMSPFIRWIQARLLELKESSPQSFLGDRLYDHRAFDAYLKEYAEEAASKD